MKPQNGKWTGLFITQGGTTARIDLDLTFAENSIQGSFSVAPFVGSSWRGPANGKITAGSYSDAGDIHMEEASNAAALGTATFDGVYSPAGNAQVIRGTVLITRGTQEQIGNLTIYSTEPVPTGVALSAHVWGE